MIRLTEKCIIYIIKKMGKGDEVREPHEQDNCSETS